MKKSEKSFKIPGKLKKRGKKRTGSGCSVDEYEACKTETTVLVRRDLHEFQSVTSSRGSVPIGAD